MRELFPGYFRPTEAEFAELWEKCTFAVDANVVLNLYRYSRTAQEALMQALLQVADRLFFPHQAAREFLRNRLGVIAGQADEYNKAIKNAQDLHGLLSNAKRHPFLVDGDLEKLRISTDTTVAALEKQRLSLLQRLNSDQILDWVERTFTGHTGTAYDDARMREIEKEGAVRYEKSIPPGYKDGKKDASGDPYRKFGDLIVWSQVIDVAAKQKTPVILVTDDLKEDWWLEQAGRTIAPRPELIEEFKAKTGQVFWMYSVDRFLVELASYRKVPVSQQVVAEVQEIQEVAREKAAADAVEADVNATFMRPVRVSPPLAEIIGIDEAPRTEIVSRLWGYIKANRLQDRENKRMVNCDEKMFAVFGRDQISMFEMASLIGKHVQPSRKGRK